MVHIKITKGLDIPIEGQPSGTPKPLKLSSESSPEKKPKQIALNLDPFDDIRFKLLAKKGDVVKIGEPLVEDKATEGRVWTSPAAGTIVEVRRGLKRRLLDIVIEVDSEETSKDHGSLDPQAASKEEIIDKLKKGGLFALIRSRPFNVLADPTKRPRDIFVKAVESAPFVPPAELQIKGHEDSFQTGLAALAKLTDGHVHLTYHKSCTFTPFTEAKNVKKHTIEGPHPIGTHSVHIQHIAPIKGIDDTVWTLNAHDVAAIGHLLKTGHILIDRVVSIAGPGIIEGRVGYFTIRAGYPVASLISNRVKKGLIRFVSGNPLTGQKVEQDGFLGFHHDTFTSIPESIDREFLHFFRLGVDKYTFSKAYAAGHFRQGSRKYRFTTSLHGEPRAFIDPTLYEKVMPLAIPTMQLVKAVMAEDYDLAEELGLLEVESDDFALPTFVCPSKVEMTQIIDKGLKAHAAEMLE